MNMRDLSLDSAHAMFDLAHIIAHGVHRTADVAQMFEDDVVRLSHGLRVSCRHGIVNNPPERPHFTATMKIRGKRNSTLPSACGL